jgi:tetratricopeptide (TPR) repeat protein
MNSFNNTKLKKAQVIQETANIYFGTRSKNRTVLNESANRKHDYDTLKNLTRKSIDVTLAQPKQPLTTLYHPAQPTKPYYKRVSNHFRKQSNRYEEEDPVPNNPRTSKSPYVRLSNAKPDKELQGRTTALNRSTHKIRSGQLLKQNSPRYFYRQPRSSLSQHYDPSIETSLHKRKVSVATDEKTYLLDEAKEFYKNNNYGKAVEVLRKYLRIHRNAVEAHYLLGMSLINSNEFNLGIEELTHTLELDPNYKRSLYLVIALAYKRLQKF